MVLVGHEIGKGLCFDGKDDDGDGKVDCDDDDCKRQYPQACNAKGAGAGKKPNATKTGYTHEGQGKSCFDHQDNDGDGLVDCQDPDCRNGALNKYAKFCAGKGGSSKGGASKGGKGGTSHESGKQCFDGVDNDHDGVSDCQDPDCKALATKYAQYCPGKGGSSKGGSAKGGKGN